MSSQQQGDVLFIQTPRIETGAFDETLQFTIEVDNGVVTMTGAFETAAILSLQGGNYGDDGVPGNPATYWGNLLETDDTFKYVSRFQHFLNKLAVTTANLLLLEEAATLDLEWFLLTGIADSLSVVASIPTVNHISLDVVITAVGIESRFTFTDNWKASV
jgi:phage gp46-like protein